DPGLFWFSIDQSISYKGNRLDLPVGFTRDVQKQLVDNFGTRQNYYDLDKEFYDLNQSRSTNEASGQLRTAISRIRKVLKKEKIPFQIITNRGESYLLTFSTYDEDSRGSSASSEYS